MTNFNEAWLKPGAVVPVDMATTGALLAEARRLRMNLSAVTTALEEVTGMYGMQLEDQLAAVIDNVKAWKIDLAEAQGEVERLTYACSDAMRERDDCKHALSESVQMCDQAQKAALHAQEECLKAQGVCLGAQQGEREALRKRAESMDYAEECRAAAENVLRHCEDAGAAGETQFERDVMALRAVVNRRTEICKGSDGEEVRSLPVGGAQLTQAGGDSGGMPLSVGRSRPDKTATSSTPTPVSAETHVPAAAATPGLDTLAGDGTNSCHAVGPIDKLAREGEAAYRSGDAKVFAAWVIENACLIVGGLMTLAEANRRTSQCLPQTDAEAIKAFKDRFPPPPNPRAKV